MIYAVIVTYNPIFDLLNRQFNSLLNQVDRIIYVDNHSTSIEFKNHFPDKKVVFILNSDNLGLGKAQNQGIGMASKCGAEYIILFDQDSVPPEGFVDGLLRCYQEQSKNNKVALVGPAIRNMLNSSTENEPGVLFWGVSIKKILVRSATEVTYCIASGSLMPIVVFNEIGMMDEKLFIDGLDLEWCLRARSKGYKIYQTNNTYLDHCLGDGGSKRILSHAPMREYYIMRNAIWMIKQRHIPTGYRIRRGLLSVGRLIQSVFCFKFAYVKADIKGIVDGLKM